MTRRHLPGEAEAHALPSGTRAWLLQPNPIPDEICPEREGQRVANGLCPRSDRSAPASVWTAVPGSVSGTGISTRVFVRFDPCSLNTCRGRGQRAPGCPSAYLQSGFLALGNLFWGPENVGSPTIRAAGGPATCLSQPVRSCGAGSGAKGRRSASPGPLSRGRWLRCPRVR